MESQSVPVAGPRQVRWLPYVLEVTDLDPLRFGLIFERFLIRNASVRQISTSIFVRIARSDRLRARKNLWFPGVHRSLPSHSGCEEEIRDVGRVMGLSYSDADRIAKDDSE